MAGLSLPLSSDILSGAPAVPLTDAEMRVLYIFEALLNERIEQDNVFDNFEDFTLDHARIENVRNAFMNAKNRWTVTS